MRIKTKMLAPVLMLSAAASFALTAPAAAFPGMPQQGGAQGAPPQAVAPQAPQETPSGKVVETMTSGGYTYVLLENGGKKMWAAVPKTDAKVGQQVSLAPGMVMQNFTSKTLNRTFEQIYFCQGLSVIQAKK